MTIKVLGIHDGHTSTVCLLVNGKVASMASEERFNRIKSYGGPPIHTINWILRENGLTPNDIDAVSIVGYINPITDISFYRKGRHNIFSHMTKILPASAMASKSLSKIYLKIKNKSRRKLTNVKELLGILNRTPQDISLVEHHLAHAHASYFSSGFQNKTGESLIITYDGSGDGVCCTVSIGRAYNIKTIFSIPSYHSFGIFFSRVTQFLGMKPLEHEYKVMGLAPYAPDQSKKQAYEILSKYFSLSEDGLSFVNHSKRWGNTLLEKLRKDLFLIRFDGVAWAIQQIFEELFTDFILNWVKKTGIHRLVLGGGSFMNVKFNMQLLNCHEIEEIYFSPSCGDESTALGAAYHSYLELTKRERANPQIEPLGPLYYGYQLTEQEILRALEKYQGRIGYEKYEDIEGRTAQLISEDKIVGRVRGRMEWGARALGNRSIVASPTSLNTVRKINAAIKMRDFWMPFAPSILWERRDDYIINPRDLDAPYMIVAFESTELARKELLAALHPFDLTCRPQIVCKEWNPLYYELLKKYESLTGIGGVLNTSFNLHGDSIVMTAEDAVYTLLNSGLDYITLENYLVWRE